MRKMGKRAVVLALGSALCISGTAGAASSGTALKAKVINGGVYVNVSDMNKALGTSGAYNSANGTYTLSADRVPQVVKNVSPSVVGIIAVQPRERPWQEEIDTTWLTARVLSFVPMDGL